MGYDPTANPPRGELCIRGPTLFGGYFKEAEMTADALGGSSVPCWVGFGVDGFGRVAVRRHRIHGHCHAPT
jgi:hypothetical protein